jgi:hypothetical protein
VCVSTAGAGLGAIDAPAILPLCRFEGGARLWYNGLDRHVLWCFKGVLATLVLLCLLTGEGYRV